MFDNVLVGVDGRANARDAVALASRLMGPDGKLTLVHLHPGELHPLHAITPALLREEREASERLLTDERDACGVDAQLVSRVAASPGRGLHEQAEEQGADLIVVGSCSRGAFGRALLGDDARAALNGAPCAVAIAPHGYAAQPAAVAKVGVAYNSSPESVAALDRARELARQSGASVHALEVVWMPTIAYAGIASPTVGDTIELMLKEAASRMQQLPDVDGRAVYGLAGEELATFSGELDVLVVGSRSYGPVRRLVLGSTSDYLQRHARCALLVLPRAAGDADSGETS